MMLGADAAGEDGAFAWVENLHQLFHELPMTEQTGRTFYFNMKPVSIAYEIYEFASMHFFFD